MHSYNLRGCVWVGSGYKVFDLSTGASVRTTGQSQQGAVVVQQDQTAVMLHPPLQHVHIQLCLLTSLGCTLALELQYHCTNTNLHYVCHQAICTPHEALHRLCCVGMGHADSCSCIAGPVFCTSMHITHQRTTLQRAQTTFWLQVCTCGRMAVTHFVQMRASNCCLAWHQVTPLKRRSFKAEPHRTLMGSLRVLMLA